MTEQTYVNLPQLLRFHRFVQASFFSVRRSNLCAALAAAILILLAGCRPRLSTDEKAERAALRQALRDHAYDKAAEIADRIVQRHPGENGAWDRLLQAQAGKQDLAAAKSTLDRWRAAITKPSPKIDEYAGDLALAERDPVRALQFWKGVLSAHAKNSRVLEKVARLEHTRQHWHEENDAWSALLEISENATARVNRALCERRMHRWEEALEDLHKAQQAAPDDPEVRRASRLFDRLNKYLAEIRDLDARLAVAPSDAATITDRALLFLRADDWESALEDSTLAAKLANWAVRPKLIRGMALVALARADECEALGVRRSLRVDALTPEFLETVSRLDAEISVERTNADLYIERAWQLNDVGQPRLALDDARNAQRIEPRSAGAYAESSYALMKLGRGQEAYDQIKRATELDPNVSAAWQYRGEIEMARGKFVQAIDALTKGLALKQTAVALLKREQCYRR
ncbi:MAG: hypothetical protein ABI795_00005, partial [Chthoniobacterales bacterium]